MTRVSRRSNTSTPIAGTEAVAKSGLFIRGEAGRDNTQHEIDEASKRREIAEKGRGPLRFFVPVGETKEIIVLDDSPDFFIYEHNIQNPTTGKWGLTVPCIKTQDNCPICENIQESYYALFLSVLDLTPFTSKDGTTHEFSRKLMPVKYGQQSKFNRLYQKKGTIRGALFTCSRDRKTDAAIGSDIDFEEMVPEEELANGYIRSWKDREGKEHTENEGFPIDYESIVKKPTMDYLLQLTGAEPTPGSKQQVSKSLSDSSDDGWEDDDDASFDTDSKEKEVQPETSGRADRASRRGRRG